MIRPVVVFDFETHLIKPGMVTPRPVCMAWLFNDDKPSLVDGDYMGELLEDHLEDSDVTLIGHNVAYDLGVACAEWPALIPLVFTAYEEGRIRCTKVRQQLIDIARGETQFRHRNSVTSKTDTSLAGCIKHYFGEHLEKEDTWRLRYGELDGVPLDKWPEDARTYPLGDVVSTRRVYDAQKALCEEHSWGKQGEPPDERRQTMADWATHLISAWGNRTDGEAVAALRHEMQRLVNSAQELLEKSGMINGPDAKTRKNMSVIYARVEADCAARGVPVPLTDGGKTSTSKEVLEAAHDPVLVLLGESEKWMKTLDTFVPTLERGTKWPICPRYGIVSSGRISASNPNMLNMPRGGTVRECFVPRPGFVFADCDYDTIELRALAQLCVNHCKTDSRMAKAFVNGADPHLEFAAGMLDIAVADAQARLAAGDNEIADARQLAKVANFGFMGGMSAPSFTSYAHGFDAKFKATVNDELSTKLRERWFETWPEMREYFNYVGGKMTPAGATIYQEYSGRVRGDVNFTAAANGYVQGLAADGAKDAVWRVMKECHLDRKSPLFGSRIVIFLYDEIIIETPEQRAHDAAQRLALVMREEMQQWVPDVPVRCAPVLMRRWYKGAKPIYVSNRLVPSRPEKADGKTKWVIDIDESKVKLKAA